MSVRKRHSGNLPERVVSPDIFQLLHGNNIYQIVEQGGAPPAFFSDRRDYLMTQYTPISNTIYHLHIAPDTEHIRITCLGTECVDMQLDTEYGSIKELPEWVQQRLAVLMVVASDPTIDIEGIGRRASDNTYWVYPIAG